MSPTEVQVIPSPQLLAGLTALLGTHGPFTAMTLGLYQTQLTLSRNTVLADIVPATYVGYAVVAGVVFSASYLDVDGSALAIGANALFACTASTTPNTIFGYFFTDAGVANLLIAYAYQTAIGIGESGQGIVVAPFVRYSGN